VLRHWHPQALQKKVTKSYIDRLTKGNLGLLLFAMNTTTPESIERKLSSQTDGLDRRLMNGQLNQNDYDVEIAKLNAWYESELDKLP
jgi:hypothetical protein